MDEKLLKRARKKFLSSILSRELCAIQDSPLSKAYRLSTACCNSLVVGNDQTLQSTYYCKRRWCQTCASITMSIQIDNYLQPLSKYKDLYFVTLTRRSIQADQVVDTIEQMQKQWRQITDLARKSRTEFSGVKKLELKVGRGGHGYHPHYHIIVEGESNANWLIEQWLRRSNNSVAAAQDMRRVNNLDNALIELMKYATKLTCADDTDNQVLCTPKQMDVIFRALHRRRLFQPFGSCKVQLSEDHFEATEERINRAAGLYEWIGYDWIHTLYGHTLTNYRPEGDEIQIYRNYNRKKNLK